MLHSLCYCSLSVSGSRAFIHMTNDVHDSYNCLFSLIIFILGARLLFENNIHFLFLMGRRKYGPYQFHWTVMASAECSSPRHQIRRRRTIHTNESKEKREKQQINALLLLLFKQSQTSSLVIIQMVENWIYNNHKRGIECLGRKKNQLLRWSLTMWINNKTLFFIVQRRINIDTLHAGCTPQVNSAEHTARDVMKI